MAEDTTTADVDIGVEQAFGLVELLADEVGPRRPTGRAERLAAEAVRAELSERGITARLEGFDGYATFGLPFGIIAGLAVAPCLLPRRSRAARATLALGAAALLASEGSLRFTPLTRALARRRSQNLVAAIEPAGPVKRTVCLVSHLDSSRSGVLFHPAFSGALNPWIGAQAGAVLAGACEPLLDRTGLGRALIAAARVIAGAGLALLLERELRGWDVPGANDNASGVAVTAQLACECVAQPLAGTRLVVLMTGCEESGLLGAQAFLRAHDTREWLFVNFDSVGGPATLRFIEREGVLAKWKADGALIRLARRVAADRPEVALEPAEGPIGLTYDATAVMARGGRAITFVAANGAIPNYHRPTDTAANVDPGALGRALGAGREMLAAIDRGDAD